MSRLLSLAFLILAACVGGCAVEVASSCTADEDCWGDRDGLGARQVCDASLGACVAPCSPLRAGSCGVGYECRLRSFSEEVGLCVPATGVRVGAGEACGSISECPEGFICAGTCERLCRLTGVCTGSETCTAVEGLSGLLGVCL